MWSYCGAGPVAMTEVEEGLLDGLALRTNADVAKSVYAADFIGVPAGKLAA